MGMSSGLKMSRDRLWARPCPGTALLLVYLSLHTEGINNDNLSSPLLSAFGVTARVDDGGVDPLNQRRRTAAEPTDGRGKQRPNLFWNRRPKDEKSLLPDVGPPPPPPPPKELPLRFLRAGKGDPVKGLQRYEATLAWRKKERIDGILREAFPDFSFIKKHYPHYYHLHGRNGEPCFYEQPAKINLRALREGGVNLEKLLRYYTMLTEFQWQYLDRCDMASSIYIIDLAGIRMKDFFGETVDFVKKAAAISAQHYPERSGYVFVINDPSWFKLIWKVVRPIVDEATLKKIYVLRGADEIRQNLLQRISLENIPPEYGGTSMPLGQAPEEQLLADLMAHNDGLASQRKAICAGCKPHTNPEHWACSFCRWTPARSY